MKKILIICLFMLLLTGCSKSFTCTLESNEESYNVEQEIVFEIGKDNMVTTSTINYKMIFETEKEATDYFELFETLDQDYELIQEKNKVIIKSTMDYTEYNNTKEELISQFEEDGYICK